MPTEPVMTVESVRIYDDGGGRTHWECNEGHKLVRSAVNTSVVILAAAKAHNEAAHKDAGLQRKML